MKATRDRILSISFNLFMQKGYKGVTLNTIIKETGVSKGGFYHYFPSKEMLFKEVIDLYFQSGLDTFFDNLPKNNLLKFIQQYIQNLEMLLKQLKTHFGFQESSEGLSYYGMLFDIMRLFPEYNLKTEELYNKQIYTWSSIIKEAQDSNEIESNLDNKDLAKLFAVINDGVVIKYITLGKTEELLIEIENKFMLIYHMISIKKLR